MSSASQVHWQRGKLGDLLPLKYGKGLPEKSRDSSGAVPVFGSSGQVGRHSHPLTSGPTLIVGRKGTVGAVHLSPEPCWPIDTVYFAEAEEGQNLKYYKYLLDSLNLARLDRSTAVPGLSRDDYSAVKVTIAPRSEQDQIVAELEKQFSRLDGAVADLKRVQANLRRYVAATLRAAFAGQLVPKEAELSRRHGHSFEPGSELLARLRSTRDSRKTKAVELPPTSSGAPAIEGWVWTTLGECFKVSVGATPSRKEPAYWGGSVPWVSSGEVQFSRITRTKESITEAGLANSSTQINPAGSVLLGMIGQGRTRGQAAILDIAAANNQNCAAIWVPGTPVPPEFVYFWLMSRYVQTRGEGSGNNQQALNKSLVEAIPLPLHPLVEQHRIVAEVDRRLSIVRGVEAEVDANLQRAQALRRAVLARAFADSGESGQ